MREAFFVKQVGAVATLTMPNQGNFMAGGEYLFEAGGNRKTFNQIANLPNCYLLSTTLKSAIEYRFGCSGVVLKQYEKYSHDYDSSENYLPNYKITIFHYCYIFSCLRCIY